MRITYLHQYYTTPAMSGGTRSFEMARRLVAKGHEVNLITSWREKDGRRKWFVTDEEGITVHWLPVPYSNRLSYGRRMLAFFRFAAGAARRSASLDSDLVFATSTPLTIALPAVAAARRQGVPMVFEVRDLWPDLPIAVGALRDPCSRYLARALERWAYRNSAAVVALSPGMRDGVLRTGYPTERVAVIPNSCDSNAFRVPPDEGLEFRRRRAWLGSRPLLVYAGAFGRINGVGFMVDLASHLLSIDPEICILLVGDGLEKELVTQRADAAGVLGVNLFIEPPLPKRDMPALLSAAQMAASLCLDIPQLQANSANKFFDALAAGQPVLLNYGGWQADLLLTHDAGLVIWRQDMETAARKIAACLHDEDWQRRASRASRLLADRFFDRDHLADKLEQVLLAVKDGKPERAAAIADGRFGTSDSGRG